MRTTPWIFASGSPTRGHFFAFLFCVRVDRIKTKHPPQINRQIEPQTAFSKRSGRLKPALEYYSCYISDGLFNRPLQSLAQAPLTDCN
ncbi:TPA: hypothetical protein ACQWGN_001378 [Neisseria subflava]